MQAKYVLLPEYKIAFSFDGNLKHENSISYEY